jgi:hypothetical protein
MKKEQNFRESTDTSNELYTLLGAVDDFPKYGDVMSMEDFIDCCKCGGFIDYDGFGHPALKDKMNSDIWLTPSKALEGDYDKRYTHVVWFNR